LKHHEALAAAEAGLSVLLLGHWHSERPGMAALAPRLAARFAGVPIRLSHADAAPVRCV
jgi:putative NIF3 family GTP cyclohydrolase 1 type 2